MRPAVHAVGFLVLFLLHWVCGCYVRTKNNFISVCNMEEKHKQHFQANKEPSFEFETFKINGKKIGHDKSISQHTAKCFAGHAWGISDWKAAEFQKNVGNARRWLVAAISSRQNVRISRFGS